MDQSEFEDLWVGIGTLTCNTLVFRTSNLYFFIKENWICAMTRYYAEPNINLLFTRNLRIDSGVRKWSHPLTIPFTVCGLYRTIQRVVNLNMTWLGFVFVLVLSVHMHRAVLFYSLLERLWQGPFKTERPRSRGWTNFGRRWTMGWRVMKIREFSWTSYV